MSDQNCSSRTAALQVLYEQGAHLFAFHVERDPDDPTKKRYTMPDAWQDQRSDLDAVLRATHVGLIPGSLGLIVPDVDVKDGKDGPDRQRLGNERIAKVMEWAGETPCIVRTPSNGAHLFYAEDTERGKRILRGVLDVTLEVFGHTGFIELYDPARLNHHIRVLPIFKGTIPEHGSQSASQARGGGSGAKRGVEPGDRHNGFLARMVAALRNDADPMPAVTKAMHDARNANLPTGEMADLVEWVNENVPGGDGVKVEEPVGEVFSHGELADLWSHFHGKDWLYVPELDEWRHWQDGEGWSKDADQSIRLSVSGLARQCWRKMTRKGPAIELEKQGSVATANGGIKMAQSLCPAPLATWDSDRQLMGVGSGMVLDLKAGEARPQVRGDRQVLRAACPPRPGKLDPECEVVQWLRQKFPDDAKRRWVAKFIGSLLSGDTTEQVALWLHGPTATGKSTLLAMVEALMHDYAFTLAGDLLAVARNPRGTERGYALARGPGKRVMLVNEWEEDTALDSAFFCSLTGCDVINVRQVSQKPFDYRPQFKLLIASNDLPSGGLTPPVLRRLVTIEMGEGHADRIEPDIWLKLTRDGLQDFAAWALAGYRLWRKEGLRPLPKSDVKLPVSGLNVGLLMQQAVEAGLVVEDADGEIGKQQLAYLIKHLPAANSAKGNNLRDALAKALNGKTVRGKGYFRGYRLP